MGEVEEGFEGERAVCEKTDKNDRDAFGTENISVA